MDHAPVPSAVHGVYAVRCEPALSDLAGDGSHDPALEQHLVPQLVFILQGVVAALVDQDAALCVAIVVDTGPLDLVPEVIGDAACPASWNAITSSGRQSSTSVASSNKAALLGGREAEGADGRRAGLYRPQAQPFQHVAPRATKAQIFWGAGWGAGNENGPRRPVFPSVLAERAGFEPAVGY